MLDPVRYVPRWPEVEAVVWTGDAEEVDALRAWGEGDLELLETNTLAWSYVMGAYVSPRGGVVMLAEAGKHPDSLLVVRGHTLFELVKPGQALVRRQGPDGYEFDVLERAELERRFRPSLATPPPA